ncbi:MAG: hypothetical protein BGO93_11255 [Mesorhizobium sp. 65-26]|jgi:hypothetical protein|uniref:DUF6629 family protein n=1 Tax=Mesorhizobium sp. 65-26 TaxID=1895781 RepID=UPI0009658A11|nr:DUF6629 family protein [Mesorhizobium sp. 65-26]OJX79759.1 MAG: hypothetical protein BGO93_11255 [Mesorhizobium sp. 65-26]
MCFSAKASFTAAALLLPSGAFSILRAYRTDRRYAPICALPLLFGLQQLLEGFVWTSSASGDRDLVKFYAIGYMFFSWLAWPIWVPFSTYFLEPLRRKPLYLLFAIAGAILGAGQYLPYFVHSDWLSVQFLDSAIVYDGVELFDFLFARELTYAIYLMLIILPLLLSTRGEIRIFGVLVAIVAAITYLFFRFAYISAFCFGGALMSFYLVAMIFRIDRGRHNAVSLTVAVDID